jgi:hypothetical protein
MANNFSRGSAKNRGGIVVFFIGLIVALAVGWLGLPLIMFSGQEQPIRFDHKLHVEDQSMSCSDCHSMRADGTYAGLPTVESCETCHAEVIGSDPDEARFVAEYVQTGREVPWLVYQKQPDNVFFSHAAHSLENCATCHEAYEKENDVCVSCHPNVATSDSNPVYRENRLTGYSSMTMKMSECESCHAVHMQTEQTAASNACFVCHK